jgi:hypothetical protein
VLAVSELIADMVLAYPEEEREARRLSCMLDSCVVLLLLEHSLFVKHSNRRPVVVSKCDIDGF